MMPEGRWLAGEQQPARPPAEPSPAVANYRAGYRDGRFDALSEVLGILNSLPPAPGPYADAHRAIRVLFTKLARGER